MAKMKKASAQGAVSRTGPGTYTLLIIWALVNLFPVYWMFTFSLKNNEEIFGDNVAGLPKYWLWSNYKDAMTTGRMDIYFLNSIIVAVATIAITLPPSEACVCFSRDLKSVSVR